MNQATDRESQAFDAAANNYDAMMKWHRYFSAGWIVDHIRELDHLAECRVLDLGCGTGLNVNVLSEHRSGIRADGVDISPKMLELARTTGKYEGVYLHDLNEPLPAIASETFDLIIAFGCLGFVSRLDICLSECGRMLKDGGKLWAGFRRFEAGDQASPPRQSSVNGATLTGYSAAEILQMIRFLDMRLIALDPVDALITATGFAYPYYVVQAQKVS